MQTTQALAASRAVRTDLAALGIAGLGMGMLAVAAIFIGYRVSMPYDGANGAYVTSGWSARGLEVGASDSTTLRQGDVVVSVNGVELDAWLRGSTARPALHVEDTLHYGVLRDGELTGVDVRLVGYPLLGVLLANWGTLLWLVLMIGVAGYLFVRRPHEAATRALLILSAAILGSSVPWMLGVGPPDLVAGAIGPALYLTSSYLLFTVFWAAMLHFALVFPRPFAAGPRQRWLVTAAYLVPIGSQVAWASASLPGSGSLVAWVGGWNSGQLLLVPAVLLGVMALIALQWRRSAGDERLRLRSIMAAGLASAGIVLVGWYLPESLTGSSILPWSAVGLAGLPFPLAIALTVRRGGLFGIRTILHRSLVYGGLTAGIVLAYWASIVLLSDLLPGEGLYAQKLLAAGAAALVALPLRDRLQRGVSRLLYGDRDDPYRAITRLGARLEASLEPEAVLPMVAETVAAALRLPYAAIELRRNGSAVVAAAHGEPNGELERVPLTHRGEEIGWLALAPRAPDEPFSAADRALLGDLARQAGAAAYAVRLTQDLRRSRQQLVSAREEERRRLGRDLHDGVGPSLAGSLLKLEAARRRHPAEMDALLAELATETRRTIDDVRRLAYELRPPVLDQLGLVGALRQDADRLSAGGLQVRVEAPDQMPELPAAVEVAAYRIGSEALANAARHAHGSHARATLTVTDDALCLEVSDDGRGMTPVRHAGLGLTSMRERAEELGGELSLGTATEGGVRVAARLPLPEAEVDG